jgi:hypothetical protein
MARTSILSGKVVIILILFWWLFTGEVSACVGARPMGMGGAFTAISDDINAIYWNPAGLSELKKTEFIYTHEPDKGWFYNWKKEKRYRGYISSYPHFIGFGCRKGRWGIGLAYVDVSRHAESKWRGKLWLYGALGTRITKKLSLGVKLGYRKVEDPSWEFFEKPSIDRASPVPMIFGIGLLYKIRDNISFGVLFQGVGNVRPAISIKPNEKLLIAYGLYDLFDVVDTEHNYQVGVEYKMSKNLVLRGGFYNGNLSIGFGYISSSFNFDYYFWTHKWSFLEYYRSGVGFTLKY